MIYKGDNTSAFDSKFLTIELENLNNLKVSKAIFVCGKIKKTYNKPEFPLEVVLNETETAQLYYHNDAYLIVYDEQGRKLTCDGCISFSAKKEVV